MLTCRTSWFFIKFQAASKLIRKYWIHVENFEMKCQAVIGIHYFDITAGFQCTRLLNAWKSLNDHIKNSVISPSLKWVKFYLVRKCRCKREINAWNFMLKFRTVSEKSVKKIPGTIYIGTPCRRGLFQKKLLCQQGGIAQSPLYATVVRTVMVYLLQSLLFTPKNK